MGAVAGIEFGNGDAGGVSIFLVGAIQEDVIIVISSTICGLIVAILFAQRTTMMR